MAELKISLFVERNGKIEEFNGFSNDEIAAISQRLSRSMSTYYTNHNNELPDLVKLL